MGKDVSMAGAKTVSKTLQTPKLRLFIIITTHKNNLPFQQIVLLTFFFLSFFLVPCRVSIHKQNLD